MFLNMIILFKIIITNFLIYVLNIEENMEKTNTTHTIS